MIKERKDWDYPSVITWKEFSVKICLAFGCSLKQKFGNEIGIVALLKVCILTLKEVLVRVLESSLIYSHNFSHRKYFVVTWMNKMVSENWVAWFLGILHQIIQKYAGVHNIFVHKERIILLRVEMCQDTTKWTLDDSVHFWLLEMKQMCKSLICFLIRAGAQVSRMS